MIPAQRRQNIRALLQRNEILLVGDLVMQMGISESTLRRDLREMAEAKEVDLLRGGGVKLHREEQVELSIDIRLLVCPEEKQRIARYAARLIYPGDILFLDGSSISYIMLDYLETGLITVVTNSLPHANKLIKAGVDCTLIGGNVIPGIGACAGPYAERMMRQLRFTKSFLGTRGASLRQGLTSMDARATLIHQLAIEQSVHTYFLVDSSKMGRVEMNQSAAIDACTILTDHPHEELEGLTNVIYVGQET